MFQSVVRTPVNTMQIRQVCLHNFRNYRAVQVSLSPGKTILTGENAQGKSNFLEALELASTGRSLRAAQDADLITWGQERLSLEVLFERGGAKQSLSLHLASCRQPGAKPLQRQIKINGVSHGLMKSLLGHLVTVSFQSQDLNLIRGGPKYRRDWIDGVILRLRPAFHETLSRYQKTVSQRNRLLKSIAEKGRLTVADQDQLLAWDKQVSRFGAQIIKQRTSVIAQLLPVAQQHQSHLSGKREELKAEYFFKAPEPAIADEGALPGEDFIAPQPLYNLLESDEQSLALSLTRLFKERRGEEIARKQTLIGPHRDDIVMRINGAPASDFGSQGQQRSLVLALKLAELERLSESLDERPVLLLDDVMAELDAGRQRLLISAVGKATQTIITTTDLTGFEPDWLADASIYTVAAGSISAA